MVSGGRWRAFGGWRLLRQRTARASARPCIAPFAPCSRLPHRATIHNPAAGGTQLAVGRKPLHHLGPTAMQLHGSHGCAQVALALLQVAHAPPDWPPRLYNAAAARRARPPATAAERSAAGAPLLCLPPHTHRYPWRWPSPLWCARRCGPTPAAGAGPPGGRRGHGRAALAGCRLALPCWLRLLTRPSHAPSNSPAQLVEQDVGRQCVPHDGRQVKAHGVQPAPGPGRHCRAASATPRPARPF